MRQLLTRNFGWKVLSLLIAAALWLGVAREPELATSVTAPIELRKMPADLDISGNLPDRVRLELRGPSGRLSFGNLGTVAVVLDLSDAHAGEQTYTIRADNVNLPAGVAFYRAVPSQIILNLDRLLSREVPVQPVYTNMPAGYRVSGQAITPARVAIRGPESRVRNIGQVRTDPLDLSGVPGEGEFRTHLNVADPQVRLGVPSEVIVRVQLTNTVGEAAK